MTMVISEQPSRIWNLPPTFNLRVDRSGMSVSEYLRSRGVTWTFGEESHADCVLYKEDVGPLALNRLWLEVKRSVLKPVPFISLIGEPRHIAPAAYRLARKENTLAIAPGNELRRLYFASEWLDPMLDDWHKRADCICWIARSLPERVALARHLMDKDIPLHIYSKQPWPVPAWQGYADDEVAVARRYRYRIVMENSCSDGYHSEKLFNSIRCGCITFYRGDPSLDLSHVSEAFLSLDLETVQRRGELAPDILKGIERLLFSSGWEIYSFRAFYDRIIELTTHLAAK